MRFYLHRVRLNSQGYTSSGYYFGIGTPLYAYQSECGAEGGHVRGATRDKAKAEVRRLHGETCTFYR